MFAIYKAASKCSTVETLTPFSFFKVEHNFENENLVVKSKDYYFSNVIARSSKTMVECNNSKLNLKSTGTEG